MARRTNMWLIIVLASFTIAEINCLQVMFEMNKALLKTVDEARELSNDIEVKPMPTSQPGANNIVVTSSKSAPSHRDSLHPEHAKNVTTIHQARVANSGDSGIRCFCNMGGCVTTSYMCKAEGGCFSDLTDVHRASHGCVNLLPKAKQDECILGVRTPGSKLMCCKHHMCNYIDSALMRHMLNSTYSGEHGASNPDSGRVSFDSDVWLKAATIAVPICGGFILILLMVLAVKILRKDSKRQTPSVRGGAYIKCQGVPLKGGANQHSKTKLLLEESYDKNMANAKLNFNPSNPPTSVPNKQNNVFPVSHDEDNAQLPLCKNIIKWGNNNQDSASPV